MQKRIITGFVLAAASLLCVDAMAIAPGFYMGLMMGPASNTGGDVDIQVDPRPTPTNPIANTAIGNPKSTQFGSRLFFGYKFNPYAGFEGGFTYFSGIAYTLKDSSLTPSAGTTGRVRGIDFLGKLDYSFRDTVGVFAKLGVTATYTTTPGALNVTNYEIKDAGTPNAKAVDFGSSSQDVKLNPTVAVGASYDFNQSWQIDASWTHLQLSGVLKGMDFYAIGLSYHFVDVYCGQFLCAD